MLLRLSYVAKPIAAEGTSCKHQIGNVSCETLQITTIVNSICAKCANIQPVQEISHEILGEVMHSLSCS